MLRYPADRVCIVLLTGLGDVVHGLPVANALKRDDPRRHITWVAEPMPAQLLAHHPAVDELVIFHKREGLQGVRRLWRELRGREFDLTLNFNIYGKSIFPTLFSGAPHRVGFDRARTRDGVWLASNHHLEPRPRAHTQDMYLEFLEHLRVDDRAVEWRIAATAAEIARERELLRSLGDRPVASMVIASSRAVKDWDARRYAEVADALSERFGYGVVLAGGPSARERETAAAIVANARSNPLLALRDRVGSITALLAGSRLVISPDTGPLHIARALGVPVIGLYGHTNPWRGGPWRSFHDLIIDRYTEPGEEPDPSLFAAKRGRMELITVQDVLGRVERATERYVDLAAPLPARLEVAGEATPGRGDTAALQSL